ncbi:hypothetical protein Pmani_039307 [Petrolisthes manimaculis]|uniref:Uncharacterized protein n=1 Tax=Petrolisthes manimaculis TaxID=1843537 RepID=A0AAE1NCU4_9EUCA|nr:hypothetical protein Pmani_039307 [Petrolisthes manimaculis]
MFTGFLLFFLIRDDDHSLTWITPSPTDYTKSKRIHQVQEITPSPRDYTKVKRLHQRQEITPRSTDYTKANRFSSTTQGLLNGPGYYAVSSTLYHRQPTNHHLILLKNPLSPFLIPPLPPPSPNSPSFILSYPSSLPIPHLITHSSLSIPHPSTPHPSFHPSYHYLQLPILLPIPHLTTHNSSSLIPNTPSFFQPTNPPPPTPHPSSHLSTPAMQAS